MMGGSLLPPGDESKIEVGMKTSCPTVWSHTRDVNPSPQLSETLTPPTRRGPVPVYKSLKKSILFLARAVCQDYFSPLERLPRRVCEVFQR